MYLKSDLLPHCEVWPDPRHKQWRHENGHTHEQGALSHSPWVSLVYGRPPLQADAVDPKSRHKGKLETESLLTARGVNWTSIRPVYIYGPLNYNPVEEWFFHRLKAGRPIPIPGAGNQITQLGHVKVSRNSDDTMDWHALRWTRCFRGCALLN